MELWVDRERRTARLVQACYRHYLGEPTAAKLHALCKLTWITKNSSGAVLDNTRSVVAPALCTLMGVKLSAIELPNLAKELRRAGVPDDVLRPASRPVGFTNFYSGFRSIALRWIEANLPMVAPLVQAVVEARSDDAVRTVYRELESLPPLPRPGAGDLSAFNLLTPVLACLDERGRTPIVNSREAVLQRLRLRGLSSATLVEQYDGLVDLIGRAGIVDAFALDTADDEDIEDALKGGKQGRPSNGGKKAPKPLSGRSDEDLEYLRSTNAVTVQLLHNSMTNALLSLCRKARLVVEQGSEQTCLFDALIREYLGTERHLLVEVKTESTPALSRLAVGQLLDYRRQHPDRAAMDLAVLFPAKPEKSVRDFLAYVGVKAAWFDTDMTELDGQVRSAELY